MCGSSACLPALHALAHEPALALNVRTAIALTLERLAKRGVELDADQAQATPAALTADPIPGSFVIPQRLVMQSLQGDPAPSTNPTAEDHRWQLHLVIARARLALGLPPHPAAEEYRHDPRLTVRRAFAQLPQPAPIPAAAPAS
jgi:hypothetical protein